MKWMPIALPLALLGTACAHSGPALTGAERLELYRAHAGEPVAGFQIDRIEGSTRWTPLGDQALAVWNTPARGHLLELRAPCPGLPFASSIAISNSFGQVDARLDSVQPRTANGSTIGQPCRIWSARPLDGTALGEAKRELRGTRLVERTDAAPEDGG